jgi:hypothetical protein
MLVDNNTDGTSCCVYITTLVTGTRHDAALYVDYLLYFKRYYTLYVQWEVGETMLQLCVEMCRVLVTVDTSHS